MIPAARPILGHLERAAVDRVLRSGRIAQGPEVNAFEHEFSRLVDGRHCIAVNSGTAALHLGLLAAGITPGDEVIVPSFTFAATANSVVLAGARPVFADIDPRSFCLDPDSVESVITPRTTAVMPVHLYGHPADMSGLQRICSRHGLALIEDAAQAHSARWLDQPVGSFGVIAAFSFYPTKNMTAGEGGMIVTPNHEMARKARLLRNQGMEQRYANEIVGYNARMTDIHAAIGRVQLSRLGEWTATRQANAQELDNRLEGLNGVIPPPVSNEATHVYHQYTIRVVGRDRDAVRERLQESGVGTGVYYPIPTHALPSFGLGLDLPETARAAREVLSLPVHPSLSRDELVTIAEALAAAIATLA